VAGLADPNAAIELSLARANRLMLSGSGNTLAILQQADRELLDRLQWIAKKHGGPAGTYTEAHAQIYRQQIRIVTNYVQQRMLGKTDEQAREAIQLGVKQTVDLATRLEEHWTGITRPLALHSQQMQDEIVRGTGASRIRQNEASWERYGAAMTTSFERQLRVGQLMGLTHSQLIDRVVSEGAKGGIDAAVLHGQTPGAFPPPTGYVRERYWAERIVRTETANAYNSANLNTMQGFRNTDFPDMQKKILAHFDNRTAPDSIAVHGQIRPLDGYFMDGAGRQYLHPPGRPNDRECVIPWRPHWQELEATEPPPIVEQIEAQQEAAGEKLPAHGVAQKRAAAIGAIQTAAVARKIAKGPAEERAAQLVQSGEAQPTEAELAKQAAKDAKKAEKAAKVAVLKAEKQAAKEEAKAVKAALKKINDIGKQAAKNAQKRATTEAKERAKEERARRKVATLSGVALNTGAPVPAELAKAHNGTPLRPLPFMARKRLPKELPEAERIEIGRALRESSKAAQSRTFRPVLAANQAINDSNYQYRMWKGLRGESPIMDEGAARGAERFSKEHDFLIRRYQEGATRQELVALELTHEQKKHFATTEPDPYTRELAEKKADRAIRAAHELERAFVLAEDSPLKTVFRGIGGLSDERLNLFLGSKHFDMLGMTSSTSQEPHVAENFMVGNIAKHKGHGLLMRLKRKSKGIGIGAVSRYPDEKEVLVHGNTRYRILSRHRIDDVLGFQSWEIDAEEF
jgi:hypothetical protein